MNAGELRGWLEDLAALPELLRRLAGMGGPERLTDFSAPAFGDIRRQVVAALHPPRMELEVAELIPETPSTRTLRMRRVDGPLPPFRAGQYVNLFLELEGVRTSRPYSISSPPGGETIDLTVREKPGGFVSPYLVREVKVGQRFTTTGPRGHFRYEPLIDGDSLIFIAGGSGITPLMAMIRDFARQGWPVEVQLIYGSRTTDEIVFRKELAALASRTRRLRVDHVISEPYPGFGGMSGLLDRRRLDRLLPRGGRLRRRCFVCGPLELYEMVRAALLELRVPDFRIRRELYGPPAAITADPAWPAGLSPEHRCQVKVAGGPTFEAAASEPLLNSLERHGLAIPVVCRSGECSACRIRLLSGRVLVPSHVGIRQADRTAGYIHPCATYPIENLEVRL